MRILATTDFSTRSNRALRQAGLLARLAKSQLHILHVVDDDQPEELILMEKREAGRVLREQIDSMPELGDIKTSPLVVAGDPFDGILRTSASVKADLIVMGAHRKQLLRDIFVGTTIERVIRNGNVPVLMVNNEAQRTYENVVVPVDMSDASANALRFVLSTGLVPDERVTLLHAFSALAKRKMIVAGTDPASIASYVESERQGVMDELAAFLVANDLGSRRWSLRVEEGEIMEVISGAVSNLHPDLVVMGTRSRSVLLKALIGSVTQEVLRSLSVDILAIPPKQPSLPS